MFSWVQSKPHEDALLWNCKFCRVGVGSTHRCSVQVTNEQLRIVWTSGLIERARTFKPYNLLRATKDPERERVIRVHIITTPDSNGDSEYKTYDLSSFATKDGPDSFEAAVNAVAFAYRPLIGRCLVFINPISGTRSGPKRFKQVHHLFHLVGLEFDAVTTTRHGHASEVVASVDLSRYCCIISVSGDGTLQEIFSSLLKRPDSASAIRTPVGCIPAGSEGTLAKISTFFNPLAAAYVILKRHEVRPLDVLEVRQEGVHTYCVCGVGWGIPGKMAEDSEGMRKFYGKSRYAVSMLRELVNLKGCRGTLYVMPAKERPLCYCGPKCARCKACAETAERQRVCEEQQARIAMEQDKLREPQGGGPPVPARVRQDEGLGGRHVRSDASAAKEEAGVALGDEELVFDEGLCETCGARYASLREGKEIPCPQCELHKVAPQGGGAGGGQAGAGASGRDECGIGGVLKAGLGENCGIVSDGRRRGEDGTSSGGAGGRVLGGEEVEEVVKLDYSRRLQGLGDASDRGSGLLMLADQWRREEEAMAASRSSGAVRSNKTHAEGVWHELDGEFIAVGGLNTERISAPYAHMSDGCMDVIAVPAQVGRMDLLQMGFEMPTGGHLEDRRIFHWKATQMKFTPQDVNDKFNVDGEVLEGTPIHIKVLPALARVITCIDDPSANDTGFFF